MNSRKTKRKNRQPAARRLQAFGRSGFSLVELLVVISIIALLVAIAVPSFSKVRRQSKVVATRSILTSAQAGLEAFRGEQEFGRYPPSSSGITSSTNTGLMNPSLNPGHVSNPVLESASGLDDAAVRITGASLLVYALAGADLQGTAGFLDKNGDGFWENNFGNAAPSAAQQVNLYHTDPGGGLNAPRYGTFAGQQMLDSINCFTRDQNSLSCAEDLEIANFSGNARSLPPHGMSKSELNQRVFVDLFGYPILYYRARKGARNVVTAANGAVGIYDHRDNSLITGGVSPGMSSGNANGTWFKGSNPSPHALLNTETAFSNFILDPRTSTGRQAPYRADSFLLISPGPDRFFGTDDDVKNWGN